MIAKAVLDRFFYKPYLYIKLFISKLLAFQTHAKYSLSPETIGKEMYSLSKRFGERTEYFNCLDFKWKFMFPFVGKAYEFMIENFQKDIKILDICGGCGNLGLALAFKGFGNYLLADINRLRMGWGELLWAKCGKSLKWQKENALHMSFSPETFDILTLLGWENAYLPYSYTLKECARVLRKGGYLIFTYHDTAEVVEGCWDWDPERSYSYLPYSIDKDSLHKLCDQLGLGIEREERAGHPASVRPFFPDKKGRYFPQHIVFSRKN